MPFPDNSFDGCCSTFLILKRHCSKSARLDHPADFKFSDNLPAHPVRAIRPLGSRIDGAPSSLYFIKPDANSEHYWVAQRDAYIAVSCYEIYRWFTSRWDQCPNCPTEWDLVLNDIPYSPNIIFRVVNK